MAFWPRWYHRYPSSSSKPKPKPPFAFQVIMAKKETIYAQPVPMILSTS